jgi:hypothetical protein
MECKGEIIVVGSWLDGSIMLRAIRLRASGIIAGGIDPQLMPKAHLSPVPLVVTEGAGQIPINASIFELLTEHAGTVTAIRGGEDKSLGRAGPEIILPLPETDSEQNKELPGTRALRAGDAVRLTRPPYQGLTGIVIGAEPRLTVYRSGVRTTAVRIQLNDGRRVYVPHTNLELMMA